MRVGQVLADTEFITSQYSRLFINPTFGFPAYAAVNLPGGGPAYPFGALGALGSGAGRELGGARRRVRRQSDRPGPARADGRLSSPSGTGFHLNDGVFAIGETQYSPTAGEGAAGLPGTYKLGARYRTGRSANPFRDADGPLLAGPLGGVQLLRRRPGTKDQELGAFMRVMGGLAAATCTTSTWTRA